jgi:hypothetical protein
MRIFLQAANVKPNGHDERCHPGHSPAGFPLWHFGTGAGRVDLREVPENLRASHSSPGSRRPRR